MHPSRAGRDGPGRLAIPTRGGRTRRWFGAAVGLAFVLAVTLAVTHSRIFELRTLRITGNVRLTSDRVASLAGLGSKTNVLWTSTHAIEVRLERNPWVKDARVSRTLPSIVSVSITERTPAAILSGSDLVVASDGTVLGRARPNDRLPMIDGSGASGRVALIQDDLPALVVVRALPPSLLPVVATVGLDRTGRLVLTLRDGTPVLLGSDIQAAAKGVALEGLLTWMNRTGTRASSIDLTVATAPAIRPAG